MTFNTAADFAPGRLSDGGNDVTITVAGTGRMIFDYTVGGPTATSLGAGTTISIQAGSTAVVQGINGGSNPLDAAGLELSGGTLQLDSRFGAVSFDNAVSLTQDSTIEVVPDNVTITLGSASNGVSLNGHTLTIDAFGGARGAEGFTTVSAPGATLRIDGVISGAGDLVLRSAPFNTAQLPVGGNLTLTAANTFTGTVAVLGHEVFTQGRMGGQAHLTLSGNGSLLGLNAATPIQLTNGQLTLDNTVTAVASRIADAQGITLNQGILQYTANTAVGSAETVGAIVSGSGFNQFRETNTAMGINTTLTMASLTRDNRSTLSFQGANLGSAATGAARFLFTSAPALVGGGGAPGSTDLSILPYAIASNTVTGGNAQWNLATNDVNGIRPLTNAEYTTLAAAAPTSNARSSLTGVLIGNGVTLNAYVIDNISSDSTVVVGLNSGTTLAPTSGVLVFTAQFAPHRTITLLGASGTGAVLDFGAAEGQIFVMNTAGATIGGVAAGNRIEMRGTNGFTVSGTGQLTVLGDNSAALSGLVTINGTSLNILADNSLGATGVGVLTDDLALGGGSLRFGAAMTLHAERTVTLLANSFGGFDTSGGNATVAGNIVGGGDLLKIGGNTLTLTGAGNTYTGKTIIYGGTLAASLANLPNTASSAIENYGTLAFSQPGGGTYNGSISGNGAVTIAVAGGGTFGYAGTNSYSGATTVTSNDTTLSGTVANLNGYIDVTGTNSGVTIDQASGSALSSATIAGLASFTKTGAGTLVLANASATNNFTGATNVEGGTLAFSAAEQLGSSAGTVSISNGSTLQFIAPQFATSANSTTLARDVALGSGDAAIDVTGFADGYVAPVANVLTIAGAITGGAAVESFTKDGVGTLILTGTGNTYASETEIDAGTLFVAGSLNGTAAVNVASGATLAGGGSITTAADGSVLLAAGSRLAPEAGATPFAMVLGLGLLDISAAVNATNSQSLIYALDTTATSSQVAVTSGTLNIGTGVLEFDDFVFSTLGGFTEDTYTLFQTDGVNSTINGTLGASLTGTLNGMTATVAVQGNDIVLLVIPEPNALSLLAGSLGLALGLQRFRRRRTA
jgi:autotransporter-associated beta strand protein